MQIELTEGSTNTKEVSRGKFSFKKQRLNVERHVFMVKSFQNKSKETEELQEWKRNALSSHWLPEYLYLGSFALGFHLLMHFIQNHPSISSVSLCPPPLPQNPAAFFEVAQSLAAISNRYTTVNTFPKSSV